MKAKNTRPSGKFVLRVPPDLHSHLRSLAQKKGLSLNQLILKTLEKDSASNETPDFSWALTAWPHRILAIVKFGSQVRGEATERSDVDLLIVLDRAAELSPELYRKWTQTAPDDFANWNPQFVHLPRGIDDAGSLWFEVALEGEFLWEKDSSVREFIYKVKDAIASGRLIRKWSHGQPYWIRNHPE